MVEPPDRGRNWGGARTGAGRPTRFAHSLTLDVTSPQRDHIQAKAAELAIPMTEYVRGLIDADIAKVNRKSRRTRGDRTEVSSEGLHREK